MAWQNSTAMVGNGGGPGSGPEGGNNAGHSQGTEYTLQGRMMLNPSPRLQFSSEEEASRRLRC